jgi:creatinine amidohydrolase
MPTALVATSMRRATIGFASLLLLFLAGAAPARAAGTVFLEELTWTELRDLVKAGTTTILVPIGGTEQSGPDMALGKHNVRARALSERIARQLGNAVVAPVLGYVPEGNISPPTEWMRFPGTITMPDEIFEKVLEYAARSFRLHGFRDIVFLGDHGGYQKDEKIVADKLNREWAATPVRVHALPEYYGVTETSYVDALKSHGVRDDEIGSHAGLADTSLLLAVDPRLVRLDRLRASGKLGPADGVHGDPRRASAELGQLGVDLIVATTLDAIRKATSR